MKQQNPLYKKLIEGVDASKREITPENIKKVNKFLEKKSSEPVSFVMEALVGLLRNVKRGDMKSVELYLKTHEGFMIGINRLNFKKLNFTYCQENL